MSMTPGLAAGDLCEIVDHPAWTTERGRDAIGLTVVLTQGPLWYVEPEWMHWSPYWRVSGLPAALAGSVAKHHEVSPRVLRKIPPAPMDVETQETAQV
jgi:hypothetical protein